MTITNAASAAGGDIAIGVDIGGTKINAGLVTREGGVLHTVSLGTMAGTARTEDRVLQAVETLMAEASAASAGRACAGIGVGSAGQIDWAAGSVRSASDLIPGYAGTPLRRILEQRFGLPVVVDNDVNVLALTERLLGAGRGSSSFVCLALGTGVGGAVVADGRLLHGAWGGGGELGHLSVDFNGPACLCGGRGCLEQYASGTSIARRMREKLAGYGLPDEGIDTREVFARWKSGDAVAAEVMEETLAALGSAVASLIHALNPELIVIGGGVAEAGDDLFEGVRREAAQRTMPSMWKGVRIEPAYRGNWSGMIGAALQVWEYAGSE
ncbi:ROK family protein [Paenibacillus sp. 1P03SA]|uniref:ROK family protein n=1 Tax=Paenibacillus sp. 1P03SA TaxID=3132294 RepID=UPI0039A32B93